MAYKININARKTPEQEIFVSFRCNVLSASNIEHNNISFKTQAIEFNGKKQTEIPIIYLSSLDDQRIFNKINKLQKGNKIEISGNLIENSNDKIAVSIIYLEYANTINFASTSTSSKLLWLSLIDSSKKKPVDQIETNDLPDFLNSYEKDKVDNKDNEDKIVETTKGNFFFY